MFDEVGTENCTRQEAVVNNPSRHTVALWNEALWFDSAWGCAMWVNISSTCYSLITSKRKDPPFWYAKGPVSSQPLCYAFPRISLLLRASYVLILSQTLCWHRTESKAGMVSVLMELLILSNQITTAQGATSSPKAWDSRKCQLGMPSYLAQATEMGWFSETEKIYEEQDCRKRSGIQFGVCLTCQVNGWVSC